jgi:hypothetical protein
MAAGVDRYPMDLAELVRMTDAVVPKPRHPKTYRKPPSQRRDSKVRHYAPDLPGVSLDGRRLTVDAVRHVGYR